jgi:hypothetical protein
VTRRTVIGNRSPMGHLDDVRRTCPPTRLEHAILLAGYTGDKFVVNKPLTGRQEQVSPAPFIAAYGVALKPGTLSPSQVRLAGKRPCHRMTRCPACWSTVASAARGGRVALRKAALES